MLDTAMLTTQASGIVNAARLINTVLCLFLSLAYIYQFFYLAIALIKKPKEYAKTDQTKKYAVLISARNESAVLPTLLKSINAQTYPQDKIDTWVIADNCTDDTAEKAEQLGARVVIRNNKELIGKGYALTHLLNVIRGSGTFKEKYDAFFVIDADNVLEPDYVEEMDKAFSSGYRIVTSYRNSKNFGDNWISAGYGMWFLREARYLNNPRCLLNTSCAVSGTGFMFAADIMDKEDGWNYHLLTEDIEFTTDMVCKGEKVGYAHKAMLFDEQPVKFSQSWKQRKRWAKGMFQVFNKHGKDMAKGVFKGIFGCYDMMMTTMPAFIISFITMVLDLLSIIAALFVGQAYAVMRILQFFGGFLTFAYGILFLWGGLTVITERKNIFCGKKKLIWYIFTFPIFMFTFLPCSICALFMKVKWDHIDHTVVRNCEQIESEGKE